MPSVPHILKMRHRRWQVESRKPNRFLGLGCAALFTLILGGFLIAVPIGYASTIDELPSVEKLPYLLEPPNGLLLQPTHIYDRSGEHILQIVQNPVIQERRYLPISEITAPQANEFISPSLINATITVLEPDFRKNSGFSLQIVGKEETPPIAQRLVRNLLLTEEEPGIQNSIRERILAWQITDQFGHDKILEWYLNSLYYGNLAYGVDAAAQIYFGKPASALTLAEAAILTAVGESPALNPFDAPEEALKRQKIVLEAMVWQGQITTEEAEAAAITQVEFKTPIKNTDIIAKDYVNLVWEQLAPFYDLEQIERGGFNIITSLDFELQLQATCTRDALVSQFQNLSSNQLNIEECPAARYLPTLSIDTQHLSENLSATVVILDPSTGQILALVGDSKNGQNPAHLPGRPPGSMLTPFVYLTAFTRGFSPASLLWDVDIEIPEISIPTFERYHGPVRLRSALANNYLNPAIQTIAQIGADNVWLTTQKMGLTSFARFAGDTTPTTCRGCSLLFDSGEVTLLELINAYNTFANKGLMIGQSFSTGDENNLQPLHPISILEIANRHGQEWTFESNLESRPVITPQLAYLMTNILSDEAARWPSLGHPNPLEIGRPAAVKIGSTVDQQDTWTIGYTPHSMVGVWAGIANPEETLDDVVPEKISAALWHALTKYITESIPAESWDIPSGVNTIDVCDPSGELPTRHCPTVVKEVFLSGNEPTQFDSLYQSFQINRETGLLATVFTPPELVEERVFMTVPPIANTWVIDANIPIPPESFDVIAMPPINENAKITQPQMFKTIRDKIKILGTVSGDDFISYRLQVGQGLNPQVWVQIGEDHSQPVEEGILATWDTKDFNGLYAVQMIVLRENRKVDTTTIQITVDNQPPEVTIPYPKMNQQFQYEFDKYITFQAEANDNIGLESVIFTIDGKELIRQTQAPFAIPWRLASGKHQLRVQAIDLAGNTSEDNVSFVVTE